MIAASEESASKYQLVEQPLGKIMLRNFLGGLVWGAGTVLGATLIVVVLGFVISTTKQIPFIGDVVRVVMDQVENQLDQSRYFARPRQ